MYSEKSQVLYFIENDDDSYKNFRKRVKYKEQYCPFDNLLLVDELKYFFIEYENSIRLHQQDVEESLLFHNQENKEEVYTFSNYCNEIKNEILGRFEKIGYKYEKYLLNIF